MPALLHFVGYWSEKIVYYIIYYFFGVYSNLSYLTAKRKRRLPALVLGSALDVSLESIAEHCPDRRREPCTVDHLCGGLVEKVITHCNHFLDDCDCFIAFGVAHFFVPLFLFSVLIISQYFSLVKRFFSEKIIYFLVT